MKFILLQSLYGPPILLNIQEIESIQEIPEQGKLNSSLLDKSPAKTRLLTRGRSLYEVFDTADEISAKIRQVENE